MIIITFTIFLEHANAQSVHNSGGKVFVMYAGSLLKIFEKDFGPAFQNDKNYKYVGEGKGSVQIANMILEGFRNPDIFISAGAIPIDKLIDNNPSFAQWLMKFASAEMVIEYSSNSRFYHDLEKARTGEIPWYKVVSEKGFKFGRTDPELDPKGYNTIFTAKLSNIYYNNSDIKQSILGEDGNLKQIFPEETLNTVLESGQVDAIAAYKHEAISRGLPYIQLPPQINLGDPKFSSFYNKTLYTFPNFDHKIVRGDPVYFAVTIPTTSKNINGSISFVNFLLSNNGRHILENQGLDYLKKPIIEGKIKEVPSQIKVSIK